MTEIEYFLGYRPKGDLTSACFGIVKKCVFVKEGLITFAWFVASAPPRI